MYCRYFLIFCIEFWGNTKVAFIILVSPTISTNQIAVSSGKGSILINNMDYFDFLRWIREIQEARKWCNEIKLPDSFDRYIKSDFFILVFSFIQIMAFQNVICTRNHAHCWDFKWVVFPLSLSIKLRDSQRFIYVFLTSEVENDVNFYFC